MEFWIPQFRNGQVYDLVTWRPLFLLINNLLNIPKIRNTCDCLHALLDRVQIDDVKADVSLIGFEGYFYTAAAIDH